MTVHEAFLEQDLLDLQNKVEEKEKCIEAIEKENANLKALKKYEVNIAKLEIEKLENENVELKKQLEMSNKVYNDNLDYSHHIEEQLTKAKEIIKELVRVEYADFTNGDYSNELSKVLEQAEQFLNSEVEK